MYYFVFIVLPFLKICFNLPSFANTFWFISSSCIVIFPVLLFPFLLHVPAFFLCFIILACFCNFFICVSSRIFHSSMVLSLFFFRGPRFSRQQISFDHRLVHLIRLYYLLIYMSLLDLFSVSILIVLHSMFF